MKKIIIILSLVIISFASYAQNDTTLVKFPVKYTKEVYTSKSNEEKVYYYAISNGVTYTSNKTSYERYKQYKKFGIIPTSVLITNKKSKRIVVL